VSSFSPLVGEKVAEGRMRGCGVKWERADEGSGRDPNGRTGWWYEVKITGSHRQFKYSKKSGRVTIAGKPGDDLAPGTFNSILKQAGLKK